VSDFSFNPGQYVAVLAHAVTTGICDLVESAPPKAGTSPEQLRAATLALFISNLLTEDFGSREQVVAMLREIADALERSGLH
jgi:hypothetical protein